MRTAMKLFSLLFMTVLLAACGSSNDATPAASALAPGGVGLTVTEVQGSATPANFVSVVDVNDNNQVVGFAEATTGASFTAALWTVSTTGAATATPSALAPIAGNSFSAAFALDRNGNAVGQSAKGSQLVAVTWRAGATAPTELPPLEATGNSVAFGISDDGAFIVGEAQNAALITRAVIWAATGGSFTNPPVVLPVNFVGGIFSSATGVSRVGTQVWVAGEAEEDTGTSHAMLWRSLDGAVFSATDLSRGGELGSTALAINSSGRVVGESETSAGTFAAVLWAADTAGEFKRTTLASSGTALSINNGGQAVGEAGGKATAWNTTGLLGGVTTLFTTASRAYGSNNGDTTGYLVVGVNEGKGFIKKVN